MSRNSANGSTRRWRELRARKLEANPACEWHMPAVEGCDALVFCGLPATEVDHIVPLKEWPEGRYVWSNLRSVCDEHHKIRHGKRPRPKIDPETGWAE